LAYGWPQVSWHGHEHYFLRVFKTVRPPPAVEMPPNEEDIAWLRSSFHPVPRPQLPDDCVEYSLYIVSQELEPSNDSEARLRLRDVQKVASDLQKKWLKDYTWQRQAFGLELVREDGEVCQAQELRSQHKTDICVAAGASLLRGRTEYGDSVEDEWVVVWLLRELTKQFKDLWIKIGDSDGEFLLIEAAGTLPGWLEPEVAENRVWIHDGSLTIIKPQHEPKTSKKQTNEKLSFQEARQTMLGEPKRLLHSVSIEEEAFYRLRNYPEQIANNMHYALVTLPRKIAFLLHQKPAYIAPAAEAFYLRDPIALKPLQVKKNDKLVFPPEDLMTMSVKFPRVAYAQLKSQGFPAPAAWAEWVASNSDKKAETGMKIWCGFEMLLSDTQHQDKPAVREMKMLLGDLETGDEKLPANDEVATWELREDDEKWLDISFDDLEGELAGKSKTKTAKRGEFGDKAAQENLQRIVAQFERFLNDDEAGPDGAGLFDEESDEEFDEDDEDSGDVDSAGEDKEASFDEDEFTKMMREMMGMPSEVMQELMSIKANGRASGTASNGEHELKRSTDRVEELDSDASDDDKEMQSIIKRMEAELNETGVLNLEPTPRKLGAARGAIKGKGKAKEPVEEESDESDDAEEHDVDVNLVKNLLESFKSQAGMAGPGGNLMGMMGLNMPRDEKQDDDEG
jgi:hypothetical protein